MLKLDHATPADLAYCRQMIRQGSKSFHLASLLLPTTYRESARALYGFCRMADDLVDNASAPQHAVVQLAQRLDRIYDGEPNDEPTDRAFADVVRRFAIPRAIPDALIEGFVWDATSKQYDTLSDVIAYGVRVAGTVGVMMSLIMGRREPVTLARAIDLGVAMQLSNIARDVEEDAKLGRVYVPRDVKSAGDLVMEAEKLYEKSRSGIALLPLSCRASINAARLLYREIGLAAAKQNHVGRAVVPTKRKLMLVSQAVAQVPVLRASDSSPCLNEGQFLVDAVLNEQVSNTKSQGLKGQIDWAMEMFVTVEERRS
jgi:phytoene synthase